MKARQEINNYFNRKLYNRCSLVYRFPSGKQATFRINEPLGRIVIERYQIVWILQYLINYMKADVDLLEGDEFDALLYYSDELFRLLFDGEKKIFDAENRQHRITLQSQMRDNDLLKIPSELMFPILWQLDFADRAILRQVSRSVKALIDDYVSPELFFIPKKMPTLAFYVFGMTYPVILKELACLTEAEKNKLTKSVLNYSYFDNEFLNPNWLVMVGSPIKRMLNNPFIALAVIGIEITFLMLALKKMEKMNFNSYHIINYYADAGVVGMALSGCIPLLGDVYIFKSSKQVEDLTRHYLNQFALQEKPKSSFVKYSLLGATAAGLLGFSFFASKCEAPCLLDTMPELSKPKVK